MSAWRKIDASCIGYSSGYSSDALWAGVQVPVQGASPCRAHHFNMTIEEQRIAIAEFCGWTKIVMVASNEHNDYVPIGVRPNYSDFPNPDTYDVPDYLHDLNAMHVAEKQAPLQYWLTLGELTAPPEPVEHTVELRIKQVAHATAAQRAEALLRTIGKWKE